MMSLSLLHITNYIKTYIARPMIKGSKLLLPNLMFSFCNSVQNHA